MKRQRYSEMRKRRKKQKPPLTLMELAQRAGVSYTTCWNLENGDEEKVDPEIKRKVAQALGTQAIFLFHSEMVRRKREAQRRNELMRELYQQREQGLLTTREIRRILTAEGFPSPRHDLLSTLLVFCPGLEFEYEYDVEDVLCKMTTDELGDLFHSGLTKEEALDHLKRAALRLGLKAPELRK